MERAERESIPLVTVLTTAYNAAPYITDTIDSICAQTFDDWEYIIVDDCSDDATLDIVDRFASRDTRFRILKRDERGGPYAAANQGFAEARGRYVARLDADDVSHPERLERQLRFLSDHPALRACATDVRVMYDDAVEDLGGDALPTLPGTLKWRACVREMPMPSTTLMERSAWEDVGGFRELPLSQDLRMWCDLARRGWLGLLPEPLVSWRRHRTQLSTVHGGGMQEDLAHDVLRDHLTMLDGEWHPQDVYRLRWAAFRPVGWSEGRRVLARFEEMWRGDGSLSTLERRELNAMMRWLRARHLRVSTKHAMSSWRWGRLLVQLRAHLRGS